MNKKLLSIILFPFFVMAELPEIIVPSSLGTAEQPEILLKKKFKDRINDYSSLFEAQFKRKDNGRICYYSSHSLNGGLNFDCSWLHEELVEVIALLKILENKFVGEEIRYETRWFHWDKISMKLGTDFYELSVSEGLRNKLDQTNSQKNLIGNLKIIIKDLEDKLISNQCPALN